MPFPDFDPDRRKILFFTRGRGRGHAVPDIEIARRLTDMWPELQFRFVSYGTGAQTLHEFGLPLIELDLPEMNGTAETTVWAGKLIGCLEPDIVIAHEEFAALPAARIFDVPAICLTDWFTQPHMHSMQSLRFAEDIVFLDDAGFYDEPEFLAGRVHYTGPVLRPFEFTVRNRTRARRELDIASGTCVLLVLPGSWTEAETPLAERVEQAFDALPSPKLLVWVGEEACVVERFERRPDVRVIPFDWQIDRLMAACDLAITKGNRKALFDLEAVGVPSISVSFGLNAIDDRRSMYFPLNRVIKAAEASPGVLAQMIREAPPSKVRTRRRRRDAVKLLAELIARRIDHQSTTEPSSAS